MNLTKPQKLIYDMEKFAGGSIAVICGSMLAPGKRGISELQRAVNEVYRLNNALRIRIIEDAAGTRQSIMEYEERKIEVLRFEDKAELDAYAEKYAKGMGIPFNAPVVTFDGEMNFDYDFGDIADGIDRADDQAEDGSLARIIAEREEHVTECRPPVPRDVQAQEEESCLQHGHREGTQDADEQVKDQACCHR